LCFYRDKVVGVFVRFRAPLTRTRACVESIASLPGAEQACAGSPAGCGDRTQLARIRWAA
jgi:hypothetical protein